jgi:hypothetical protein
MIRRTVTLFAALACLAAVPAQAKQLFFTATLSGDKMPTMTGSKAVGLAHIVVDTDAKTVDMTLDVKGIKVAQLWDKLVKAPIGPVHLHAYGAPHDHSNPGSSTLALPFPYGASYAGTVDGFRIVEKDYPYAIGAASVKSDTSFDDFVAAMEQGKIVLNIHTNAQTDGEISGEVVPDKA